MSFILSDCNGIVVIITEVNIGDDLFINAAIHVIGNCDPFKMKIL